MSNPLLELQKLLYRRLVTRRYGDIATYDGAHATVTLNGGYAVRVQCGIKVAPGDRVVVEGGQVVAKLTNSKMLGIYEV